MGEVGREDEAEGVVLEVEGGGEAEEDFRWRSWSCCDCYSAGIEPMRPFRRRSKATFKNPGVLGGSTFKILQGRNSK